jgi:predicted cobalt transporter CbtA
MDRTPGEWFAAAVRAVIIGIAFIFLVASRMNMWLAVLIIVIVALALYGWPFGPRKRAE